LRVVADEVVTSTGRWLPGRPLSRAMTAEKVTGTMIPNSWSGFDFGLGEDVDRLREPVSSFAQDMGAPRAHAIHRSNEFPRDLRPQLGELGLLGITVEEELGGAGLGYLAHCVAMEEISRGSAAVGLSYGAHSNLCVNQIRRNGTDEQKRRYLPKLMSG